VVKKLSSIVRNITDQDPMPVYFKLQMQLLKEIENGRWTPGQRIPPERILAETHNVSIGTVKKAILNLVNEGYLYRIQGKGTFVAGNTLQPESLRYYRFLESFEDEEVELQIKLLTLKVIKGVESINSLLMLKSNQDIYEIRRVFFREGKPVVYSVSYLPQKMFEDLKAFPIHKFENVPLYIALEESYGLPTIFNRELIKTDRANKDTAKVLAIRKGSPVLLMEMLSFTYKQKPYEYRRSYCLTDNRALFRELM
jgi:GntR family transcriptional regulator